MKTDVILYEKIYKNLKYKIECGLLPEGYQLPSRANMCREYETSEKPVRIAIEMLAQDGLVETKPRMRPRVARHSNAVHRAAQLSLQKAAAASANDALKTGVLLCYPIVGRGISLCGREDWKVPQTIVAHMDPARTTEFWHLSNRLWRYFIARNGNEFILRTVDSMGYSDLAPAAGGYEVRSRYLSKLKEFLQTVMEGGDPAGVAFDDMSFVYGFNGGQNQDVPTYQVPADSVFLLGAKHLKYAVQRREERYSRVYLDIVGLISMGFYKRGDYLPTHKELQKFYGVSIDTTLKAVKILKEWGVVNTAPHKGIWVTADLEDLKGISLDPKLIACHVRRFLDSLELLTLIMEGVAILAMENGGKDEAEQLYQLLESRWNDPLMFHFFPSTMLKFISGHIPYDMLRSIFEVVQGNFRIGRSIPKLIGREKTPSDYENYTKCLETVRMLKEGDIRGFAVQVSSLFQDIQSQIIEACKKYGYWEAAMEVYEATSLWK